MSAPSGGVGGGIGSSVGGGSRIGSAAAGEEGAGNRRARQSRLAALMTQRKNQLKGLNDGLNHALGGGS